MAEDTPVTEDPTASSVTVDGVTVTVPVNITGSSGVVDVTDDGNFNIAGTVDVTDDGSFSVASLPEPVTTRLEDSGGDTVDPMTESQVSAISAQDTGTGTGGAATLDLGTYRKDVDVVVDTSGAATLTFEVSRDGGSSWIQYDTKSYESGVNTVESYSVAFGDVRAYVDQNRNQVTLSSKGL